MIRNMIVCILFSHPFLLAQSIIWVLLHSNIRNQHNTAEGGGMCDVICFRCSANLSALNFWEELSVLRIIRVARYSFRMTLVLPGKFINWYFVVLFRGDTQ